MGPKHGGHTQFVEGKSISLFISVLIIHKITVFKGYYLADLTKSRELGQVPSGVVSGGKCHMVVVSGGKCHMVFVDVTWFL